VEQPWNESLKLNGESEFIRMIFEEKKYNALVLSNISKKREK
jgi:hypothetical protein